MDAGLNPTTMGERAAVLASNGRRWITVPTIVVVRGYSSNDTAQSRLKPVSGRFRERLQVERAAFHRVEVSSPDLPGGATQITFYFRADRGVRYVMEARLLSHPDTVMELLDSPWKQD